MKPTVRPHPRQSELHKPITPEPPPLWELFAVSFVPAESPPTEVEIESAEIACLEEAEYDKEREARDRVRDTDAVNRKSKRKKKNEDSSCTSISPPTSKPE